MEQTQEKLIVYDRKALLKVFPFGTTKLQKLLNAKALPVIKVGRSYLSSPEMIRRWLEENEGKEVHYET